MSAMLLFGDTVLPRYDPDRNPVQAAGTAALLLYPQQVTLARLCDWYNLPAAAAADIDRVCSNMRKRHGVEHFARAISGESVTPQPTLRETLILNGCRAFARQEEFAHEYAALISEDVVTQINIEESVAARVRERSALVPVASRMVPFMWGRYRDEFGPPVADIVIPDLVSAEHPEQYATGALAYTTFAAGINADGKIPRRARRVLEARDVNGVSFANASGRFTEALAHALYSDMFDMPVVAINEFDSHLHRRIAAGMRTFMERENSPDTEYRYLAASLLARTLVELPLIIPRNLDALLEVRQALADSLGEFRELLDGLARDLVYADKTSDRDINYATDKHLVRPLRAIERQLAKPATHLARNLFSSSSLVSGAVTLGASVVSGAGGIVGALLSSFAATLAAAVKTKAERDETVHRSQLAFLIQAKQH